MSSNALILIAALGLAGASLADETVKAGRPSDKPGRALDGDTVKSGGTGDKPGRALDDDTVKSGGRADKPGRTVEGDVAKSGGAWRQARSRGRGGEVKSVQLGLAAILTSSIIASGEVVAADRSLVQKMPTAIRLPIEG